jgi:small subunit ribosomal protein S11
LEDNERVRNILLQQYPPATATNHKSPSEPLPVLSITAKKNNTFASISTRDYRVLKSVSAGVLAMQGASRGSVEGGSRVGLKIAQLAVDKGVKDVILKLRGFAGRGGRDAAVRSILQHPGLNVVSIVEASRVQHGGCKPRKVRRV